MASHLIPDNFIQQGDNKLRELVVHSIPPYELRIHDAIGSLISTAGNDDLGVFSGSYGTAGAFVYSSDGAQTTVTQRARFIYCLPPEYSAGESVKVRVFGGMAVVSDGTATIDVECRALNTSAVQGSDLCTTAAQSINSSTYTAKDFDITSTSLAPGDRLDVRITAAITDSATASNVIMYLTQVAMLLDIRG